MSEFQTKLNVGEQVEHGGLTGTVGADQTGDLVAADHQVEAVHGGQTADCLLYTSESANILWR